METPINSIRVKLMRLTFYKNTELEPYLKQEFVVEKYKPDSQIPYGLRVGGKLVYFSRNEVYVFAEEGAHDAGDVGSDHDQRPEESPEEVEQESVQVQERHRAAAKFTFGMKKP